MSLSSKTGAIALSLVTAFGSAGCATTRGMPTLGGAAIGGALGNAAGGGVGTVIGVVGGAAVGGMFESDCHTTITSRGGRSFNGNSTSEWAGRENMNRECRYSGNSAPGNNNPPAHMQDLQGQGNNGFRLAR